MSSSSHGTYATDTPLARGSRFIRRQRNNSGTAVFAGSEEPTATIAPTKAMLTTADQGNDACASLPAFSPGGHSTTQ